MTSSPDTLPSGGSAFSVGYWQMMSIGIGQPPVPGLLEAGQALTRSERRQAGRLARRGEVPSDLSQARYVEALGRSADRAQRTVNPNTARVICAVFVVLSALIVGDQLAQEHWFGAVFTAAGGAMFAFFGIWGPGRTARMRAAGKATAQQFGIEPPAADVAVVPRETMRAAIVLAMVSYAVFFAAVWAAFIYPERPVTGVVQGVITGFVIVPVLRWQSARQLRRAESRR